MNHAVESVSFSASMEAKSTHYHDCHQILLIRKGKLRGNINGRQFEAREGSVVLFSRFETHSLQILSSSYERYILRIRPDSEGISLALSSVLSHRPEGFSNVVFLGEEFSRWEELMVRLREEFQGKQSHREEMMNLLLSQILILLSRRLPRQEELSRESDFNSVLGWQKELESCCSQSVTLRSLAERFCVSPSVLSHRFKRITGVSVMEYLASCRFADAKNLLIHTDLSVAEIVDRCGFSDGSNFSRCFKKRFGTSPTAFRKRIQKEKLPSEREPQNQSKI